MKIETTSSIPGEISSVSDVILSNKNQYFKGSVPTTFSYLMTPSIFKTDSSLWQSDTTGYHISINKDPIYGSQSYATEYLICRFKYNQNLLVDAILYKNWSALQTQRLKVQSTESLLSNLSGSIVGIMGISGFFMNLFEHYYLIYKRKRDTRLNFLMLLSQRKRIFTQNFLMNFNQFKMLQPDLNEVRNRYGHVKITDGIERYGVESIPTFRYDDPINYQVAGLDIP
jgi:hypothetical protein